MLPNKFVYPSHVNSVFAAMLALPAFYAQAEQPAADTAVEAPVGIVTAVGIGGAGVPTWLGSASHKTQVIPYLDINWHDQIEISTVDGLIVDLIHNKPWHGGLVGTMVSGRSTKDLGTLSSAVPTLGNTLQGGVYVDYDIDKSLVFGLRWRHDIQQTGAYYADAYAELDLPAPKPIEHSIKLDVSVMNKSAMRRFFGLSAQSANNLGVASYQPCGGVDSASLSYQAFIPTSTSTGFALGARWSVLGSRASNSPLIREFGSKNQTEYTASFFYHF